MKKTMPILKLSLLSVALLQHTYAVADDTHQEEQLLNNISSEDPSVILDSITIIAKDISGDSLLGGNQVSLSKDSSSLNSSLRSQKAVSLGQTLEKISGVQNNSFGANNGLPQIRSLTDSRVKVNQNGMGISGLSAISGNLPTAINPGLADSIDVHKSSATVLYGGNAIGGAVNLKTSQIPYSLPEDAVTGQVEISGGKNTTNDQSLNLTGKIGQLAWHFDAMNSEIEGYDVPNNTKATACYDVNNIWRMGQNGMGENTSLSMACQMNVVVERGFNPKYYQLINKKYLTARNEGDATLQAYMKANGLDSGTIKDLYKDPNALSWKSPMYLRVWKNKKQFNSLPAEQQKIILEEKWGGYVIPDYNNLSLNPVYEIGQEKEKETLKKFEDIVPVDKREMTNSHMHNKNVSTGLSYINDKGYVGVGVGYYKNDYGIPGYASLTTKTNLTELNKQPVNIESTQKKLSVKSVYYPEITGIDNISGQISYLNAKNEEYLGSTFANQLNAKQLQSRFEVNHYWNDFTSGAIGIDLMQRKIDGDGKDRFLPDTKSKQYGIFVMQNFNWNDWQSTLGYRNEKVKHQSFFDDGYTTTQGSHGKQGKFSKNKRDFNLNNYFIDLNWQPVDLINLTARYNYSQRSPNVNELFASNFHYATLTDEQGSPYLNKETAKTLEFSGQINWKNTKISINNFNTDYDDYIYLGNTGISREALDVKEWRQSDTIIKGWELELNQRINFENDSDLDIRLFSDMVKNHPTTKNRRHRRFYGDYMPNMPTSRYGIGLGWNKDRWEVGTTLTHYNRQKYGTNAGWEVDLPDYTLVDAYVGYQFKPTKYGTTEWFLDSRNLTNVDAHSNNSTLKYLTPLAGRSVKTGLRLSF